MTRQLATQLESGLTMEQSLDALIEQAERPATREVMTGLKIEVTAGQPLPADPVWLDLFEPTADERARVEAETAIALPTREEMREIELSSRVYRDEGGAFMTATVLWKRAREVR